MDAVGQAESEKLLQPDMGVRDPFQRRIGENTTHTHLGVSNDVEEQALDDASGTTESDVECTKGSAIADAGKLPQLEKVT